VKCRTYSLT